MSFSFPRARAATRIASLVAVNATIAVVMVGCHSNAPDAAGDVALARDLAAVQMETTSMAPTPRVDGSLGHAGAAGAAGEADLPGSDTVITALASTRRSAPSTAAQIAIATPRKKEVSIVRARSRHARETAHTSSTHRYRKHRSQ